jgi:predicted AlkP superfamily phosphohydrolase/phosphomutase
LKLLIVGLDGMTFDVINLLIDLGHLPNIAQLMQEGVHSPLLSTMPSITPVAWSSFITGKSPGDHGVYAWGIKTSDYRMDIINANYLQDQSIWTVLHRAGKRIGVIGLPMSYPPQPYPSFMVGGPLSPSVHSQFTYPESLYQEIKENIGEYVIDFDKKQQLAEGEEAFVEAMTRLVKVRGETTLYLMQKYPCDVLMPVFVATDRLQHCLWHHLDFAEPLTPIQKQIIRFYDLVDGYIGRFIEAAPDPKMVILLSDHGFGPGKRKVSLNGWLMQEGYLHRSRSDQPKSLRRRAVAVANRVGLGREQLKKWLSQIGVLDRLGDQIDKVSTYEMAFDWRNSVAFAGGSGIYLNIEGREREGIVSPGEDYERLRQEIIGKLSGLRDPHSDEAIFEKVYRREDFYSGRRVNMAPDIVPIAKDGYKIGAQFYEEGSRDIREDIFDDLREWDRGTHRREGILIAWGESLEKEFELEKHPHIWDVAPTLLALADVPIPANMTGKALVDLLRPEYRRGIKYTSEKDDGVAQRDEESLWASERDEQLVEDRLRGLGYLE